MTAIVSSHPATEHEGLNRVSKGLGFITNHIHNSRLVYAGVLAAIVVLANAWIEPSGLGAWLALWAIVFAVAALLTPSSKNHPGVIEQWLQSQRNARANEQMWQLAMSDHRVMADLLAAHNSHR